MSLVAQSVFPALERVLGSLSRQRGVRLQNSGVMVASPSVLGSFFLITMVPYAHVIFFLERIEHLYVLRYGHIPVPNMHCYSSGKLAPFQLEGKGLHRPECSSANKHFCRCVLTLFQTVYA